MQEYGHWIGVGCSNTDADRGLLKEYGHLTGLLQEYGHQTWVCCSNTDAGQGSIAGIWTPDRGPLQKDGQETVNRYPVAGIMSLGVLCDVLVWYYSKDLEIFYSEPAPPVDIKNK